MVPRLEYSRSTLGGIRTPNPWFRRPVLYPLSYEGKRARDDLLQRTTRHGNSHPEVAAFEGA